VKWLENIGLDENIRLMWVLKEQDIKTLTGTECVLVVGSLQRGN
jgi:hypothetical protein